MMPRYPRWLAPAAFSGALFVLLVSLPWLANRVGAYQDTPPAGRTGAPGEGTCASCHSGGLNDGVGTLTIGGVPTSYTPGQKYALTVSLARSGKSRWGFELTSLYTTGNAYAGTIEAPSNRTILQTRTSKVYISHTTTLGADGTFAGTSNGPVTWTFDWTAPAAGGGSVTFYAVGVACNNDGNDGSGDLVYTTNTASAEGSPTPVSGVTWGWIKSHYR
jgi:hypothetical protein